jgi:uncharacterized membrane protein YraQ (UPF0718 family)
MEQPFTMIGSGNACCATAKPAAMSGTGLLLGRSLGGRHLLLGVAALALWWVVYGQLAPFAQWLTYEALPLERGGHLGAAVEFFLYDTPKVIMLLTIVVFGIGILRSFITPETTRRILAGKRVSVGNVLAAFFGIATPFCSCSAVPLFIGFVSAGIPLGVTFSYLISAPMINEIAVVLLFGLFGWKVAAFYVSTGLLIAICAGWIIGRLGMENHIEAWVRETQIADTAKQGASLRWGDRVHYGLEAVRDIVGKVWLWVVLGIGVGAGIHGYVPEGYLASIMGNGAWWSVPLAVLIGIPLYSNAAGMIPIVSALLGKGAALGTVLAFMMSVIALSLPEMIILRRVLRPRLIATFIGVVGFGILVVGYLFNLLI